MRLVGVFQQPASVAAVPITIIGGTATLIVAAAHLRDAVRLKNNGEALSAARQSMLDTGHLLRLDVERVTGAAMSRGRKIATSSTVVAALGDRSRERLTQICNETVVNSTEIDAVAVFNRDGEILAINTVLSDGTPIPRERVEKITSRSFGDRGVIARCARNGERAEALEFQTSCDITPAFFGSSGLSVAHSQAVYGADGRQIGIVSTRLRFERITALSRERPIAGGNGSVRFVSDHGAFFDEATNRGATPPIPAGELSEIIAPLVHGQASEVLVDRDGTTHALFRVTGLATIEGGGIQVMLSMPTSWSTIDTRNAAIVGVGTPLSIGLLLLLVGATLRSRAEARVQADEAKHALLESAALRTAVEQHSIVSVADTEGRIVAVNDLFCQLSGYTQRELVGHSHRIVESGLHPVSFWTEMWQRIGSGKAWRGEICNRAKNGSLYWIDSIIAPFRGSNGAIDKFVSIGSDITARVEAQEQIAANELRMRAIIDAEPECLTVTGPNHELQEINQSGLQLFEAESVEQLRELTLLALVRPEYRELFSEMQRRVLKGASETFECQICGCRGRLRWIESRAVPLRSISGGIEAVITVSHDITDRKQAEGRVAAMHAELECRVDQQTAQLRASEMQYRTLFNSIDEGFCIIEMLYDANGKPVDYRFLEISPSFEKQTGISNAVGRRMREIAPNHEEHWFTCYGRVALTGEASRFQHRAEALNRWYDVYAFRFGEPASRQVAILFKDISDQKQMENVLREAKNAAERANRAKSEFLAHMSHEIRTPLNGVIGMTDLLLGTKLSEVQQRYASVAKCSAETLTTVINDILDFSKIEAGKLDFVINDFDLHCAVEDVIEVMSQRAHVKGLEIGCHIHRTVPRRLRGDADRLRQILINLVNNAVKFTEQGSVVVRLYGEPTTRGRTIIRFEVADTGPGIAPERIGRLFKSFSQGDASTTRLYGGTGLGLVISKQLAELMGGDIGVSSEVGHGTKFWFTIELEECGDSIASSREDLGRVSILRALVIDDCEMQSKLLCEQLETVGIASDAVSSCDEALQMLVAAASQAAPYRVAIISNKLSTPSSIEFAELIQADKRIQHTVLLVLLAAEEQVDHEKIRVRGFAGYVTKPVRQSRLAKMIDDSIASPQCRPKPVTPDEGQGVVERGKNESPAQCRGRILVAEDNEVNQIVTQEILSRAGYVCDIVETGKEAVFRALTGRYDAILMDCQMPILDGFDATREIRLRERSADRGMGRQSRIPIVALTANAMMGDKERCLQAGMDAYTSKPVNPEELIRTIERVVLNKGRSNKAKESNV
ncbi:MAG: PAS domain S-box protein [Phycisphaeraceae bacterium]|nr:PAS domain S-box protein [Phycisphaeraceae bacterium]